MGLAHEYGPDAILLDLDTEQGLLERLKQEPRTRHLPVVAIGDADKRQTALRCGAAQFVERGEERRPGAGRGRRVPRPARCATCSSSRTTRTSARRSASSSAARASRSRPPATRRGGAATSSTRGSSTASCSTSSSAARASVGFGLLEKIKADERHQRDAGDHPHRQGADPPRGDAAGALRGVDHRQGRGLARAAARRDVAVPAPAGVVAARRGPPAAGVDAPGRRGPPGPDGPDRRRRRAQRLRADERARGARDERALRRERPRGDRAARRGRRTSTSS